ncbi:hypothetical protein PGB90_003478 [Kerria lacca]
MATKENDNRKISEPPVKLIAKIEDLTLNNIGIETKTSDEANENNYKESKGNKKAIIVEKSTGTPLVTVRSRRSIMESRFRLTLKTWDDVWRSTSWAKNPPKQIKMAAIKGAPVIEDNDKKSSVETTIINSTHTSTIEDSKLLSPEEDGLRKVVSETNVNDKESDKQILHIATDEDIAVRDKEVEKTIVTCEEGENEKTNVIQMTNNKDKEEDAAVDADANETESEKVVSTVETYGDIKTDEDSVGTSELVPKKIKNTRFMVVPSVQIPVEETESDKNEREVGTAGSSDSEDATQSAASRNRVPMFESRLNELTMVESQLKKLDFKPIHLELPEDQDSDESGNSKTITAAEGKTMKIKDTIPPRRNNSLEGTYPSQSKKRSSKSDSKPTWGWLSIFRKKQPSQQINTMSSSKPSPPTNSSSSQKQTRTSTTSSHQSRIRQPQRHPTTGASARRVIQAVQPTQPNPRIVLIQVKKLLCIFLARLT